MHQSSHAVWSAGRLALALAIWLPVSAAAQSTALVPLVTDQSPLPLSNVFGVPSAAVANEYGDLLFVGAGNSGLFLRRGGSSVVVRILQARDEVPGFPGSRASAFLNPKLNNARLAAFVVDFAMATGENQRAVVTYDGTSLTKILAGTDTAPGTGGKRYERPLTLQGLNDEGDIVVLSTLVPDGSSQAAQSTLFAISSGGTSTRIAGAGDPAPGLAATFGTLSNVQTSFVDDVAFTAQITGGSGGSGIFLWRGGVLRKIAANGDPNPLGGTFSSPGTPRLNNNGHVAFAVTGSVWVDNGALLLALRTGDALPLPLGGTVGGTLNAPSDFNDIMDLAIYANVNNPAIPGANLALLRVRPLHCPPLCPPIELVAYRMQTAPDSGGKIFSSFSTSAAFITDFGSVVFGGLDASGVPIGIFIRGAGTQPLDSVAIQGQPTPAGGLYAFTSSTLAARKAFNDNSVLFGTEIADSATYYGEFRATPGVAKKVLDTSDALPAGSRVSITPNLRAAGNYVVFTARRSGGPASLVVHNLTSKAVDVLATEGSTVTGVDGRIRLQNALSSVNASGQVVVGVRAVDPGGITRTAIFVGTSASNLAKVVTSTDADPSTSDTFHNVLLGGSADINNAGQFVFSSAVSETNTTIRGVFVGASGVTPIKIAVVGDVPTVGGAITTITSNNPALINDTGQVAFHASTAAGVGIFTGSGGSISKLASVGDAAPGGGTFSTLNATIGPINADGELAFGATTSGGSGGGIFVASASSLPVPIAQTGDGTPVGGTFALTSAVRPVINNDHDIVFQASMAGGPGTSGYFLRRGPSGPIQAVAIQGQAAPGTTGVFGDLLTQFPVFGPGGHLAFQALFTEGSQPVTGTWHVSPTDTVEPIVVRGQVEPEFGGGVAVSTSSTTRWNSGGRYPLWAALSGGEYREGVFLFVPLAATTTAAGTNVVVTPTDAAAGTSPVAITFAQVVTPGDTTVTSSAGGPTVPTAFALGTPPVFYNVTTTAVFSGAVTVCIDFAGVSFPAGAVLRLLHFENGAWQDVTTSGPTGTVICGTVSSLSPFVVAQMVNGISSNLIQNGDFSGGTSGWTQFATPDMSYIVSSVVGGVFQYYRQPPPAGTSNQAVIYQLTGTPVAANTALAAEFDLGNSSSARKRISVLVLDADFSDLSVCTFWLPSNSPLQRYVMRTHTTKAWAGAAIYFYAASAGPNGGHYLLDNVSLGVSASASAARTDCVDPTAPGPGDGPDSVDLLVNGDFSAGLAPWGLFGQISQQVIDGVFEFIRLPGTPAGVVLQATNSSVPSNEAITGTFQLGNSSAVRKRVTVILHDNDFSDLAACTFWLSPGQTLADYSMRAFTTKAWTNATFSVYPATVGPAQWIRFDNAHLQRTPLSVADGTACVEPGGGE